MLINDSTRSEFEVQTRTMWIIPLVMIGGASVFGVFVCVTADWAELKNFNALDILPMAGMVFGCGAYLASFIVPVAVRSSNVKQLGPRFTNPKKLKASGKPIGPLNENHSLIRRLLVIFQTSSIIRLALIEGAVFFNFMMFMVEVHPINLCVGIFGLLLLLIAVPFPSQVWEWVESKIEDIDHSRGF